MERSFVKENARERERLISLVESLKDEELSLPLGDDWTIGIALAHLAFNGSNKKIDDLSESINWLSLCMETASTVSMLLSKSKSCDSSFARR